MDERVGRATIRGARLPRNLDRIDLSLDVALMPREVRRPYVADLANIRRGPIGGLFDLALPALWGASVGQGRDEGADHALNSSPFGSEWYRKAPDRFPSGTASDMEERTRPVPGTLAEDRSLHDQAK